MATKPVANPVGSHSMPCPKCGHTASAVLDSRNGGDKTRRRRKCVRCGERFTTYEMSASEMEKLLAIRKKHGQLINLVGELNEAIQRAGTSD